MNQDAVLADKRHQIRKRRKRHDVQVILEIDLGIGRLLQQGVEHLEGHAGAAKIVKGGAGFWIHQSRTAGPLAGNFVMVENDDVRAALSDRGDLPRGVGPPR